MSVSASLWMAPPSDSSRTWSPKVLHTQRTSPWGYTPVSGMLMTGQQEAGLWRQTGAKHHSLPPTGTSMLMLVCGLLDHLLAAKIPVLLPPTLGSTRSWTLQAKRSSSGCRRTTWFTITAQTQSVSHRAFLLNALPQTTPRKSTAHVAIHTHYFVLLPCKFWTIFVKKSMKSILQYNNYYFVNEWY